MFFFHESSVDHIPPHQPSQEFTSEVLKQAQTYPMTGLLFLYPVFLALSLLWRSLPCSGPRIPSSWTCAAHARGKNTHKRGPPRYGWFDPSKK